MVLPARLRLGASWSDACILNISSRGLLLHSTRPVTDGALVELWQGDRRIVARVVWSSGPRAGLAAEELLPVEDIAAASRPRSVEDIAAAGRPLPAGLTQVERRFVEKRKHPRSHDDARSRSRALEFWGVCAVGATLATSLFGLVEHAFALPLALIRVSLGG